MGSEMCIRDSLSDAYSRQRREQIADQAREPNPGDPHASGTVYPATADAEGNMVSFIQSYYQGFGSGVLCGGTEPRADSHIAVW